MTPLSHLTIRDSRSLYRLANAIWVALGVAAILSTFSWFLDPDAAARTALGKNLSGPLDEGWQILWGIGGMALTIGVLWLKPRMEIIGHMFVSSSVLTNAVAVVVEVGVVPTAITYVAIASASTMRTYVLMRILPRRCDDDPR